MSQQKRRIKVIRRRRRFIGTILLEKGLSTLANAFINHCCKPVQMRRIVKNPKCELYDSDGKFIKVIR